MPLEELFNNRVDLDDAGDAFETQATGEALRASIQAAGEALRSSIHPYAA
ncbi:hypothetical protein [Halovivax sp.]|nr:hypothetical protein [Halovivax sp.]